MASVSFRQVSPASPPPDCRIEAIDLEVADQERVAFTGTPFAASALLLRLVGGIAPVGAGEIRIGEKVVNPMPPREREVAMVLGDHSLYPHLTLRQNLALPLKKRRLNPGEIQRRTEEMADRLGVKAALDQKSVTLTAEQRQRAAIAKAVAQQPRALLLESPLTGLSDEAADQLRADLIQLQEEFQTTLLYAAPDPLEAMAIGQRVAILDKNGIVQCDLPDRLYHSPANRFAAECLGSPGMNFLPGLIRRVKNRLQFVETGEGTIRLPLEPRQTEVLEPRLDQEVVLGIRPEGVELLPANQPEGSDTHPVLVDLVEPMGALTRLHLQTGQHTLLGLATTMPDARALGHRARVRFDSTHLHFFDPADSSRIPIPPAA